MQVVGVGGLLFPFLVWLLEGLPEFLVTMCDCECWILGGTVC